ncbi:hypothetical protein [uncultured Eubacterium sp.]|uniref:hypothetical protein n=1 Tax=uncultured Eubacterium sp. TaxID=165185 RepID=UPI0025F4E7A0|nr:hypothetical protein [uncultured Eubacterium sp.]
MHWNELNDGGVALFRISEDVAADGKSACACIMKHCMTGNILENRGDSKNGFV